MVSMHALPQKRSVIIDVSLRVALPPSLNGQGPHIFDRVAGPPAFQAIAIGTPGSPNNLVRHGFPTMPERALPFEMLFSVFVIRGSTPSPPTLSQLTHVFDGVRKAPRANRTPGPITNVVGQRFPFVSQMATPPEFFRNTDVACGETLSTSFPSCLPHIRQTQAKAIESTPRTPTSIQNSRRHRFPNVALLALKLNP